MLRAPEDQVQEVAHPDVCLQGVPELPLVHHRVAVVAPLRREAGVEPARRDLATAHDHLWRQKDLQHIDLDVLNTA